MIVVLLGTGFLQDAILAYPSKLGTGNFLWNFLHENIKKHLKGAQVLLLSFN